MAAVDTDANALEFYDLKSRKSITDVLPIKMTQFTVHEFGAWYVLGQDGWLAVADDRNEQTGGTNSPAGNWRISRMVDQNGDTVQIGAIYATQGGLIGTAVTHRSKNERATLNFFSASAGNPFRWTALPQASLDVWDVEIYGYYVQEFEGHLYVLMTRTPPISDGADKPVDVYELNDDRLSKRLSEIPLITAGTPLLRRNDHWFFFTERASGTGDKRASVVHAIEDGKWEAEPLPNGVNPYCFWLVDGGAGSFGIRVLGVEGMLTSASITSEVQAPSTQDLLEERNASLWSLSPLFRWDAKVDSVTGITNRSLYAANPVLVDSFAQLPVGPLTSSWRLSGRIEMLRRFAIGGAGFTRFTAWDGATLLLLADVTWSSEQNRVRMEMSWWDGVAWHSVFADPIGFFGPRLSGQDVAWKDWSFDATTRKLSLSFQPEGGLAREVVSDPVPEEIVQRLNGVGVSCVDSEFLIRNLTLVKNVDNSPPEPPTLYERQLSNRDFFLFWAASPGRRYQIQESRDLMIWEDKRFVFGGSGAELLQVALPTATNGFRAFRLLVK